MCLTLQSMVWVRMRVESVGEGGRGMQVYVETVVVNGDGVGARKT